MKGIEFNNQDQQPETQHPEMRVDPVDLYPDPLREIVQENFIGWQVLVS
jgi:hypothetical protein